MVPLGSVSVDGEGKGNGCAAVSDGNVEVRGISVDVGVSLGVSNGCASASGAKRTRPPPIAHALARANLYLDCNRNLSATNDRTPTATQKFRSGPGFERKTCRFGRSQDILIPLQPQKCARPPPAACRGGLPRHRMWMRGTARRQPHDHQVRPRNRGFARPIDSSVIRPIFLKPHRGVHSSTSSSAGGRYCSSQSHPSLKSIDSITHSASQTTCSMR